jgi:hypothetical protein
MKKLKKMTLSLFLLAVFFFKLPSFYILPIQNAYFTSQAISRVLLILIFMINMIEIFLTKRKIFRHRNQKLLVILITLFFFLQSLSIIPTINTISFISRYKELIIGFTCFFNFYFYQKEYKQIVSVFLVSALINGLYQILIFFGDNQIINTVSILIYDKHWQMVSQQLNQGKLLIDTYDEIILPFLFLLIKKNKSIKSFFSSALFLAISFLSFLSNFRSRILMFIVSFLGSLFLINKINKKVALLMILTLFFSAYIANSIGLNILKKSFVNRILLTSEESKETINSRIEQLEFAFDIGNSRIIGVGLGNYYDNLPSSKKLEKYLYPRKQIEYIGAIGAVEFVHNIFGIVVTESGYLSLFIFLLILVFFLKNDTILLKKGNDYQKAFIIAFWTLFTFGFFNPTIPGSYNVFFWGLRGMLM